jgi:CBS domain containing-hemolysin-like protein
MYVNVNEPYIKINFKYSDYLIILDDKNNDFIGIISLNDLIKKILLAKN